MEDTREYDKYDKGILGKLYRQMKEEEKLFCE